MTVVVLAWQGLDRNVTLTTPKDQHQLQQKEVCKRSSTTLFCFGHFLVPFWSHFLTRLSLFSSLFCHQRAPNPPEFAQPGLSRPNASHPQQEGTNLDVFVLVWLVLPRCEATSLGVFDLCHFDLLKRGLCKFGWAWSSLNTSSARLHCSRVIV